MSFINLTNVKIHRGLSLKLSLWFQVLPMLRDADSYRDLLDRTAATLDKMEEQLKSGGKQLIPDVT